MVDSVLAPKALTASDGGKPEPAKARGSAATARANNVVGQRAFGAGFSDSGAIAQPPSNDQASVGSGLLSTGVQILLAETRSQEASVSFVPSARIGNAIGVYTETQGHVRDTIRANTGVLERGEAGVAPPSAETRLLATAEDATAGTLATAQEAAPNRLTTRSVIEV